MVSFFGAHPGLFQLFYGTESTTFFQDVENNWAIALYLVLPSSATVINIIAKICSDFTKANIDRQVKVFTIYGHNQCISEGKVILSLEVTIGIPLLIIYTVFSSFSDRLARLTFYFPFQIMLLCLIVPILVIRRNIKIMNFMKHNFIHPILDHHLIISLRKQNSTVVPLQEMIELGHI